MLENASQGIACYFDASQVLKYIPGCVASQRVAGPLHILRAVQSMALGNMSRLYTPTIPPEQD